LSDRIAYLNHDIDDAIRAGAFTLSDLPEREIKILGATTSDRINNMIISIYRNSLGKSEVSMEEDFRTATENLRDFMFEKLYKTPLARSEEERAAAMITAMYGYFRQNKDKLPAFYLGIAEREGIDVAVSDYISGMTDRYAVYCFEEIFVPKNFLMR
ncbi:MAG: deoxyguanosinetriphosphate triphosphohydrolase, partial [Clostridia bacterium]|nr:deoxyguanosinetriphosphate triphosphohydrolase [Clostridia bacterium]